ncbi:MAG TPA: S53 family peptidase [Terriglobales bacterium]|nr:S53 family peptidase [Terriglobales bacterium]
MYRSRVTLLLFFVLLATMSFAQQPAARVVANNTPGFVAHAKNLGLENSSKTIDVTIWLKQHNSDLLQKTLKDLYTKGSPKYHQWLSPATFRALHAPSAEEAQTIQKFLESHKLAVVAVGQNNTYVRARGRVADVQKAFRVQLARFQLRDGIHRANLTNPVIDEPAGSLVAAVSGLSDTKFHPNSVRPVDAETGAGYSPVPLRTALASRGASYGAFSETHCFRGTQVQGFQTPGASLPIAIYLGNRYGSDITDTRIGHLPPCGYGPMEIETAYKLNGLYKKGLDGTGQTVVIVDAFGSPTIQDDVALFSEVYGLPPADLTVMCVPTTGCPVDQDDGWAGETTLDVEYVHAVAPGAKIILIPSFNNDDLVMNEAVQYAIDNQLGTTISNSYSIPEVLGSTAELDAINATNASGAAMGISVNFSSGDNGDWNAILGVTSVDFPASSPYATAIGGTSLALNTNDSIMFQTGWGTHETRIANTAAEGNSPVVPPLVFGFIYGAGGGVSSYFAKPSFQSGLPGSARLNPDISYVADPFTGVEIIRTPVGGSDPELEVIGGTSLSCPMFSGLWSIVSQKAGGFLGQAAPLVYGLPAGAVTDVKDKGSSTNVRGAIATASGNFVERPDDLVAPLENTTHYYSAMYNSPFSTRWFVLGFGLDSSLTTGPGWDDVTGVGTPNGLNFVKAVVAAAQ